MWRSITGLDAGQTFAAFRYMSFSSRGYCALTIRQNGSESSLGVAPCNAAANAVQLAGTAAVAETLRRNSRRDPVIEHLPVSEVLWSRQSWPLHFLQLSSRRSDAARTRGFLKRRGRDFLQCKRHRRTQVRRQRRRRAQADRWRLRRDPDHDVGRLDDRRRIRVRRTGLEARGGHAEAARRMGLKEAIFLNYSNHNMDAWPSSRFAPGWSSCSATSSRYRFGLRPQRTVRAQPGSLCDGAGRRVGGGHLRREMGLS